MTIRTLFTLLTLLPCRTIGVTEVCLRGSDPRSAVVPLLTANMTVLALLADVPLVNDLSVVSMLVAAVSAMTLLTDLTLVPCWPC